MRKFIDICLGVMFFIISIILWLYLMLISSDIPVNISKNEFINSVISLLLFGVLYSFYINISKTKITVILLLIPLGIWLSSMIDAINCSYQTYHTIISTIGFTTMLYCIGLSIYKLLTNKD